MASLGVNLDHIANVFQEELRGRRAISLSQ